MSTLGPDSGFFPNDKNWWIMVKPDKKESVKEVFRGMEINIIVEGKIHRGAAIGSREYQEEFVSEELSDWLNEVVKLAWFAQTQP